MSFIFHTVTLKTDLHNMGTSTERSESYRLTLGLRNNTQFPRVHVMELFTNHKNINLAH